MVNRHSPRKNKFSNPTQNRTSDLLLYDEESREHIYYEGDRENLVSGMDADAKSEALSLISQRVDEAAEQTEAMRTQMAKSHKQYMGEWQKESDNPDEDIFLPMTREDINTVHAYLISVLAQITPIVRMEPSGNGVIMSEIEEDYKRAKLAEAMFQYYWGDKWKAIDDVMPKFLKHYLEYPMAVLKVSYYETDYDPDLMLEVKDRGFLYFDPRANELQNSGWVAEEYHIPRSEVIQRVERGDWSISDEDLYGLQTVSGSIPQSANMERFFGKNRSGGTTLTEDEMVRCVDYWQFPRLGLPDLYATVIGTANGTLTSGIQNGILVRYGRNPFPVKGNPYIGVSYNPDDRPDGQSMAMLQEPFQRVSNTLYNLRIADVRKNIRATSIIAEALVDGTTIKDIKAGNSYVRAAKSFNDLIMTDPNADIRKYIAELPSGTSTDAILVQDLQFILSMGQKSSNTPDVFRGQNANPGATLGQVQEQLSRTTGQFTPITRSIMRVVEKVAEHTTAYTRSEEFYDEERIVRIIGKNAYKETIDGWHEFGNTAYKSVTADMVDVDLTFDAISGADAIASKTLLMTNFERIMQSMNQAPQLVDLAAKKINFPNLFMRVLDINGVDTEYLTYSDKEQAANEQKDKDKLAQQMQIQKQQQQEQMQLQAQMEQMKAQISKLLEDNKQQAMAKKQIMVDQAKGIMAADNKAEELELSSELRQEEMQEQGRVDKDVDRFGNVLEKNRMDHEADLEEDALERGATVSVGKGQDNVEVDHGDSTKQS